MAESFNVKKAIDLSPIQWFKSLKMGSMLILVLFIGFTVYRAYFMETQSQTQIFKGDVKKVVIQQDRKKILIPFMEVYVEQKSETDKLGFGLRGGVRFEW